MNKSLLFLNALSAQLHPGVGAYVQEHVQASIASALGLQLCVVQARWLDIDMTQVRVRYSREAPRLPSVRETLQVLFHQTAWMHHIPLRQLHAVVVIPELFHVDKVYV